MDCKKKLTTEKLDNFLCSCPFVLRFGYVLGCPCPMFWRDFYCFSHTDGRQRRVFSPRNVTLWLVNLHCSITCSSDPFFRDVAVRKLTIVGRQCEKNNKNRARTSGKCTLEHIQSTAQTDNYTKSYPTFSCKVFI